MLESILTKPIEAFPAVGRFTVLSFMFLFMYDSNVIASCMFPSHTSSLSLFVWIWVIRIVQVPPLIVWPPNFAFLYFCDTILSLVRIVNFWSVNTNLRAMTIVPVRPSFLRSSVPVKCGLFGPACSFPQNTKLWRSAVWLVYASLQRIMTSMVSGFRLALQYRYFVGLFS